MLLRIGAGLVVLLASNTSYVVDYEIQATRIARTPQAEGTHYSPRVEALESKGRPFVRVDDEVATFEWQFFDVAFDVRITNKAKGSGAERLVVLLDRAEFVDTDGRAHGLAFFYSKDDPPREIAPGKRRDYSVCPVGYKERRQTLFGDPKAGRVAKSPEEIDDLYSGQVGKEFSIRLPVQVGTLTYRYEFDLKVSRVLPRVLPTERF